MSRFNLSEWALRNQPLVQFFIVMLAMIGVLSYRSLGQSEDPPFTFKVMLIRTAWPGATSQEIAEQVTEKIEKKLQEIPELDHLTSYSRPNESQVFFFVKESIDAQRIPDIWYLIRKKISDIRYTLPPDAVGPTFNDEFGDTFGNLYALTGDGFDYRKIKQYAENLKMELLRIPDVAKVDLIGVQDEKIYIETSNTKVATLGIGVNEIRHALESQNALTPAGRFETDSDRIYVRISGEFESVEAIRNLAIRANGHLFRLGDITHVWRGSADPPQPRMRFMGMDAIGLALSMRKGGDIIQLGKNLDVVISRLQQNLPIGLELHRVADQPQAVQRSINEFLRTLAEAIFIVLLVSFISLGFRTGLVVALSIPLVLAMTFTTMKYLGIDLHKISLGALVLALGLLVDDAIIAVEMMAVKMEQGYDRISAAAFAYTSTAFPMLTGTLVTAAGFLPIATAQSATGEYTRSIFQVVTLALLISWIVAVVFIPYLGYRLLPNVSGNRNREATTAHSYDPYASKFYRVFRKLVEFCLFYSKTVIFITLFVFILALAGFRYVQRQFFPASTRLELMVDLRLAEGSSLKATEKQAKKLETWLQKEPGVESYVSYVGSGSPRFYLPLDQQLPQTNFSQFVVLTKDLQAREQLRDDLMELFEKDFSEVRGRASRLENGPAVGYPVQFRVSGKEIEKVKSLAREVAEIVRTNKNVHNVHLDWEELSKIVKLNIDQEHARLIGVTSQEISRFLQGSLSGVTVSQYREGDQLIDIVLRGPAEERALLSMLGTVAVPTVSGKTVPLSQIATLEYGFEQGIIWRRDRLPTITVRGDIYGAIQPPTVTAQILPTLESVRAHLPLGYFLETGGTVESSLKAQNSVNAGMPLFLLIVLTLLMIQLKNFQRVLLVFLTAPLGFIGVTLFLLVFNVPFGFVAMLGTIVLAGMIMRNSVILVDQIEQDIAQGSAPWNAIIDATVRRFRPIVLTALAAILAMIPLSRSVFFGPMAVAIMGGLFVATILTLLFLPALYAAWFRVRNAESMSSSFSLS